jgi:hypothetical protein
MLQYEEGSAPSLALKATIERTEKRFANYGSAGLLCGTDGLPHLISDPGLALRFGHAGETLVRSCCLQYLQPGLFASIVFFSGNRGDYVAVTLIILLQ